MKTYITKYVLDEKTEPVNGSTLYEGYSPKYKLTIHFLYNFDLNLIETAYPVIMNDNIQQDWGKQK